MIRAMRDSDGPEVLAIYQMGMDARNATFETSAPDWAAWDQRHRPDSRFVWEEDGRAVGWVALSPISTRQAYRGVAEISIYIHPAYQGKGIGSQLMAAVIESSEVNGIWTLTAGIFPENTASLRLHLKFGFREVGYRERIARLDGHWRDTLLLERRSKVAGV